jgi:TRAP-type C4-dicarboxylate transport system permease small subunit
MNLFMRGLMVVNKAFFMVSIFFLCASTVLATLNAITRKFFIGFGGFTWAEELSTYCCVLMLFIGVAYLELTNKHLSIGILENLVRDEKKRAVLDPALRIFRGIVTLFLLGIVIRYGIIVLQNMAASNMITWALRVPKLWFFIPMLAGFAMVIVVWVSLLIFNKGKAVDYGTE